jgi:hypothetical protein
VAAGARRVLRPAGTAVVVAALLLFAGVVAPRWGHLLAWQASQDGDAGELAATAWVDRTLPAKAVVVVDDYMWPDITMHGKALPLWCWKTNGDPWVRKHILPRGYRSISYIVLSSQSSCALSPHQLPTLIVALDHSRVIKRFADGIVARKVIR